MSLSERMNMHHGEEEGAYVIRNVNLGLNAYETLSLICNELGEDLTDIDENDFYSCSLILEGFCAGCNEETGYTVSIWFD